MSQDNKAILQWIVLPLIIVAALQLFSGTREKDCTKLEPRNPFSDGGHAAGFEWAQSKDVRDCGGISTSFQQGCNEFVIQQLTYEDCLAK